MINRYLLLIIAIVSLAYSASTNIKEDESIIKAIYFGDNQNPKEAAKEWKKLFEKTNDEKYLVEYFYASLAYKDIKEVIKELKETLNKKNNKELYELLASLYTKEEDTNGLLEIYEKSVEKNIDSMYELAYLYTIQGKDNKALTIYKNIYKKNKSWDALKGILSVLAKQNKIEEASNLLWDAISKKDNNLPKEAYLVFVGLNDYKKNTEKSIYAFKRLLVLTKDKKYIKQLISLYLFKKDYNSIIELLELTKYDDKLLYELYLSKQKLIKAYKVLDRLYNKTKEPKWLAEKAILTYEITQRYNAIDKSTLNVVAELFEEAIKKGVKSPTYYNYYGYTLIDKDIDIQKGIKLVKKALKIEPNNIYYLDSLAWGYYKLNRCKEAKNIMNKIKKLKPKIFEVEILEHEDMILKCKEK